MVGVVIRFRVRARAWVQDWVMVVLVAVDRFRVRVEVRALGDKVLAIRIRIWVRATFMFRVALRVASVLIG